MIKNLKFPQIPFLFNPAAGLGTTHCIPDYFRIYDDLFLPYVMSFRKFFELKVISSDPNGIMRKIALVLAVRNGWMCLRDISLLSSN